MGEGTDTVGKSSRCTRLWMVTLALLVGVIFSGYSVDWWDPHKPASAPSIESGELTRSVLGAGVAEEAFGLVRT